MSISHWREWEIYTERMGDIHREKERERERERERKRERERDRERKRSTNDLVGFFTNVFYYL